MAESSSSTLRRTSRGIPNRIHEKEWFWLDDRRTRVRRYDTTRLCGSTQSFNRSEWDQKMQKMECIICCMIRRYDRIWDEIQDAIRCNACSDESLLAPGSPEYILPVALSISLTPESPYTHPRSVHLHHPCIPVHVPSPSLSPSSLFIHTPAVTQSSAKLSGGGGGGKRIFPPQHFPMHSKYARMYPTKYILKYTYKHALKDAPNCTPWHTVSYISSQVSSQDAHKHTAKHALKYISNCITWHTPSLLGSMLPSSLSRGKTLPISPDYMLLCLHLGAPSRDRQSCTHHAPEGRWWVWAVGGI